MLGRSSISNVIFKDESVSPYVRFVVTIRMLEYIAKTPAPFFKLEDASNYSVSKVPNLKTYRVLNNAIDNNTLQSVLLIDGISDLDKEISNFDFDEIVVQDGNVISLSVILENQNSGELASPFDEEGVLKENKTIGEKQIFKFVVNLTDFQFNIEDGNLNSFMALFRRASEDLIASNIFLEAIAEANLSEPINLYLDIVAQDDKVNSYLSLTYRYKDLLFPQDINPDITFSSIVPTTFEGDNFVHFSGGYSSEFGSILVLNFDVDNLFRSNIDANEAKIEIFDGSDWQELEAEMIQPSTAYNFGSVHIEFSNLLDSPFVFNADNLFRLSAIDEQGNVAVYDFIVNITYPLNNSIHTSVLAGEDDSSQVAIAEIDDGDGEIIDVTYDFKNYIYLATNRTSLTGTVLKYSLDNTTFIDLIGAVIVTVAGIDYWKCPIPTYGSDYYLKIYDTATNAYSRSIKSDVTQWGSYTYTIAEDFDNTAFSLEFGETELSIVETFTTYQFNIAFGSTDLEIVETFTNISFT